MKIYIVRHGQTEMNLKHVLQGNSDSPLTEKGIAGAYKIQEAFAQMDFACIITSTLQRAIKTAEIIKGERDIPIIKDPHVGEMAFGHWQGRTQEEISTTAEIGQNYINYFKHPQHYIPTEGAESFDSVLKRAGNFLDKMKEFSQENKNANVLLVSHGAFIKAILSVAKELPLEHFWEEPYITNCSISIIEINQDGLQVLEEGDTAHLGEHKVKMSVSGYLRERE